MVAALLMAFNPYNVVYIDRTSVTLLGIAALPWLMLAVHRGLREPRRWWWPAAIALVVTAAGAGVNAAVTAWVLAGPLALALYEWGRGAIDRPRAGVLRPARWRAGNPGVGCGGPGPCWCRRCTESTSCQFTEQPGAIWASTSLSESFRLMGYWPSYLGVGYGSLLPFYETSPDLLFSARRGGGHAAGARAGRRRLRRRPALGLRAVLPRPAAAGAAGHDRWASPMARRMRKGVTFVYNTFSPVQFLRTTHKAGPLVALALACLAGVGAAALVRRVGRGATRRPGRGRGRAGGGVAAAADQRRGRWTGS